MEKQIIITTRVTNKTHRGISKASKEMGLTKSDVVRLAITYYLTAREGKHDGRIWPSPEGLISDKKAN
jgi:antitoxin component of RelBE/YafQ-DinJ toxin-antitoxin module